MPKICEMKKNIRTSNKNVVSYHKFKIIMKIKPKMIALRLDVLSKTIIISIMYMRKNVKIVLFDWYIKFFNY